MEEWYSYCDIAGRSRVRKDRSAELKGLRLSLEGDGLEDPRTTEVQYTRGL